MKSLGRGGIDENENTNDSEDPLIGSHYLIYLKPKNIQSTVSYKFAWFLPIRYLHYGQKPIKSYLVETQRKNIRRARISNKYYTEY